MSACKELHSVSHTENISLLYDPFIETKHSLKMHVVLGNFIAGVFLFIGPPLLTLKS